MNKKKFLLELFLQTFFYYSIVTFIWFVYLYNIEELPVEYNFYVVILYLFVLMIIVLILKIIRYKLDKTLLGIAFQILACITYFFIINVLNDYKQLILISGLVVLFNSIFITYKKSELDSYEHVNIYSLVIPIVEFIFGAWKFDQFIKGLSVMLLTLMVIFEIMYRIFNRKEQLINDYKNDVYIPIKQISIVVKTYTAIICLAIALVSIISWLMLGNGFDGLRKLILSNNIFQNKIVEIIHEEDNALNEQKTVEDIGLGNVNIQQEKQSSQNEKNSKSKKLSINSEKISQIIVVIIVSISGIGVILAVILLIIKMKKYEKLYVIDDDFFQKVEEVDIKNNHSDDDKIKRNYLKNIFDLRKEAQVTVDNELIVKIKNNIDTVLIGKSKVVDYCLVALLAEGHILLEDVPGTGKTTLAKALAKSIDVDMTRIQFTTDLLPSDIVGIKYYNMAKQEFELKKGPIFSNFILADEINRATPKTQSAFMECMEEHQVTIDGETIKLEMPFFVIATQNPIENYGTFPLPEAQLDRFLLKVNMEYPNFEEERKIVDIYFNSSPLS